MYISSVNLLILSFIAPPPPPPDAEVKLVMSYAFRVQFISNQVMHI
jgi:hypothetical protein